MRPQCVHARTTPGRVQALSSGFIEAVEEVAVGVQGGLDRGVAEPFLDHLRVFSLSNEQRGVGVSEVVKGARLPDRRPDGLAALMGNVYARAAAGGALVGLIAFALPLTATGGSGQLAFEAQNTASLGIGLLLAVLIGKMIAITLSQEAGFLGGTVFPILFIGGTAGIVVQGLFPDIPIPLAVGGMIAAVPGAIIGAPVSFILIAVGGVGLGVAAIAPIGIAVITAHLTVSATKVFAETRDSM